MRRGGRGEKAGGTSSSVERGGKGLVDRGAAEGGRNQARATASILGPLLPAGHVRMRTDGLLAPLQAGWPHMFLRGGAPTIAPATITECAPQLPL